MKLTFKIHKPIETVFNYLTDMDLFASIHPVISKIDRVSDNNYKVHETLRFGFIPISFTYPVTVEQKIITKQVIIKATVMRVTKIEMTFNLSAENNETIIEEDISFRSPLPIKFLMESIFSKQHALLFANMEKH